MRTDGSDYKLLYNDSVHEVNVYEDKVYFATAEAIYRCNLDGSSVSKLVDGNAWFLQVTEYGLFFDRIGEKRVLCNCKLDGSSLNELIVGGVYDLLVNDGYLYYCYGADERYLYRVSLDDYSDNVQLNSNYTRWLNTDGEYLYYTNHSGNIDTGVGYGNALYRYKLDGTANEKVGQDEIEGICVLGGFLYYMSPDCELSGVLLS